METLEPDGAEEFSFQQSFGERFERALARSAPVVSGAAGVGLGHAVFPANGYDVSSGVWLTLIAIAVGLIYALWVASTTMYLEGHRPRPGALLRIYGASAGAFFVTAGFEALVRSGFKL